MILHTLLQFSIMGREGKDNDENGSVNSSASEGSPRENLDQEKDVDGVTDKARPLNDNEDTHNDEGEDDSYYDDDYNSSGLDGENQNKVSHTEEEDHLSDKASGSGFEDLDKKSKATDNKNEKESASSSSPRDSPREALDQEKDEERVASEMRSLDVSEDTQKKEGEQEGSDDNGDDSNGSDSENQNKLDEPAVGALDRDNQNSDSENLNREGLATAKVETESDSESDNPSKIYEAASDILVAGKECFSHSEILDKKSHETENLESNSDSDSENPNKMCHTADVVLGVDKDSGSDAETLDMKSQTTEKLEKEGDSENESPKKTGQTPRRDTFEEDRGLDCESPITVSRIVEEFISEEKDADPVFDGAEVPETEATQANTWLPGKAAALKNFVKMQGAVAVSNVIRRLSAGKDNDEINSPREKSVTEPAMKGTIILYTRLGCQDCKEIRSILQQKRLKWIEINVDIYPSRKLELEKNTGSSSVPRLYFNDFLVGGLSELKAMNESSKLDEKINDLNEEASSAAPLPPLPGEDDVSCTGKVDELASAAKKLKESIVLSDRYYKMRRFSNCFLGTEAVDFFSRDQDLEREEAIEFGRKLANDHFFQHVLDENVFEDGNHLYRFLEHDPSISTCYNMTRGLIEFKPKPIFEIASRLRFMSFAIFEAYVSEDGRHVDYQSIHGCEEFRRYLRITEELQRVELNGLSREEKLAFFINLYNMMVIHAILTWGYPSGALDRRRFFGDFKYVVGGCPYSLSAIQNGILRGNQRPPYSISKPFGPKDKQFKVSLPYPEPLIHFTLVCGTRSGPALRCYSPGNIDKELMEAARNFLMSAVVLDAETKVVSVNKILKWYSVDLGKNEAEVIKHAAGYLESSKSQEILDLLANNQLRVTYQPYDWGLNS